MYFLDIFKIWSINLFEKGLLFNRMFNLLTLKPHLLSSFLLFLSFLKEFLIVKYIPELGIGGKESYPGTDH